MHGVALARLADCDQLDFLELMLTDKAAYVTAITAGFGTETLGMRGHQQRQPAGFDDFIAHQIG